MGKTFQELIDEAQDTTPTGDDVIVTLDQLARHNRGVKLQNLPVSTPTTAAIATAVATNVINHGYSLVIGPSGSLCDIVCTGSHDGKTINTAIAALSGGARILIRNGTYDFSGTGDKIFIKKPNIEIDAESVGGVIFKASGGMGGGAAGRFGMLTVGQGTTPIAGVKIRGIIFDCNNQVDTTGLTLDGGADASLVGVIGLSNVLVEDVIVKNNNSGEAGLYIIGSYTSSYGANKGKVDNITFRNVEVDTSVNSGFQLLGGGMTNLKFYDCKFHGCQTNGVRYYVYSLSERNSDWLFYNCRFYNNIISSPGGTIAHVRDDNQAGVDNLHFDRCYFGSMPGNNGFAITPYSAFNNRVTNCFFDQSWACISLGLSFAGQFGNIYPLNRIFITDNIFYQVTNMFDADSSVATIFSRNIIYEGKIGAIFQPYSRHFPTIVSDNLIYDCHTGETGSLSDASRAAFRVGSDGYVVKNNMIIDDRALVNPSAAATLTQAAGGTLSSRTYYVKITFSNDTGETGASTEASLAISANNLITVNQGSNGVPSGAKKMNIYISTTTGNETLQGYIPLPNTAGLTVTWTEPITGLISGAALPGSNTTHAMTTYGIYEAAGAPTALAAARYSGNEFFGITTPIVRASGYRRIEWGNFGGANYTSTGPEFSVELQEVDDGNITGTYSITTLNGQTQKMTLTGSTTFTIPAGDYNGQIMSWKFIQDNTGSRVATWPSNFKKAGGTLTLSTAASAVDIITSRWDGTNWVELHRSMAVA